MYELLTYYGLCIFFIVIVKRNTNVLFVWSVCRAGLFDDTFPSARPYHYLYVFDE